MSVGPRSLRRFTHPNDTGAGLSSLMVVCDEPVLLTVHYLQMVSFSQFCYPHGRGQFMSRNGDRRADELRHWVIVSGVLRHAEGSALIEAGNTKVVCAATVEDRVPPFLKNSGKAG